MIPGFKTWFLQELEFYIKTMEKYQDLKTLISKIKILPNIFPPNIVVWQGASLLGSMNSEIDRFLVHKLEF